MYAYQLLIGTTATDTELDEYDNIMNPDYSTTNI